MIYEESLLEGNIDKEFKPQRGNPSSKTKSSHKKKRGSKNASAETKDSYKEN